MGNCLIDVCLFLSPFPNCYHVQLYTEQGSAVQCKCSAMKGFTIRKNGVFMVCSRFKSYPRLAISSVIRVSLDSLSSSPNDQRGSVIIAIRMSPCAFSCFSTLTIEMMLSLDAIIASVIAQNWNGSIWDESIHLNQW
jgi:hypothetical protein